MKINLKNVSVAELVAGYVDNDEEGVYGFGGKLNIRPKYQREFVYEEKQRNAVINSVVNNYPLNSIYWAVNDDKKYEVLDGQQRIVSICQYVTGVYSIDAGDLNELPQFFENLSKPVQNKILKYNLAVYFCQGNDQEKLDWFRIVNIAGVELTEQELRNAVYSGPWVTSARKYFSKRNCPAFLEADGYLSGRYLQQDYLETAIKWISRGKIEKYMSENQKKNNADLLWRKFQNIIQWIRDTFPTYRKEMKTVDWGTLYTNFNKTKLNPRKLENEISRLLEDDEVTKKSGIWNYVLTREEKFLNLRNFTESQKRQMYQRQKGKCKECKKKFDIDNMEADHIDPWHLGGKTELKNCQLLCKPCNRRKSGK